MNKNIKCKLLCNNKDLPINWDINQSKKVTERIDHEYFVHLLVDNLPVATRIHSSELSDTQFELGLRLGFVSKQQAYINNHLKFILSYHMHSK